MLELKEAGALIGTPLENIDIGQLAKTQLPLSEAEATGYLRLNLAIAIEHIVLRAVDLGLGSCWVLMFDRQGFNKIFGIEERYLAVALLPIGYPDQNPGKRPRIPLKDILLKDL